MIIMDGGMGRELKRMGAPFKQPEWSALALMEAPETVRQAHQAFIEVGAEVIITNTYAVVPFHIGQERFNNRGRELIKLAADIARDVAGDHVQVAGSLPPAFGSYRPDLFDSENAEAIYTPLIEGQESYVDIWLAETMSSIAEAKCVVDLVKRHSQKPFWLAYSVTDRNDADVPDGTPSQLRSGESIEEAVQYAVDADVDALLFNCSQVEEMHPVLEIVQNAGIDIPYGAYANSFEPVNRKGINTQANIGLTEMRAEMNPMRYLEFAQTWKDVGATIIGGCCGIGPEHIRKLCELKE